MTENGGSGAAVRWCSLTIDCPDDEGAPEALQTFYARALDGEVVRGAVRARGLVLSFRGVQGYRAPTWPGSQTPMQMHLELVVDDLAEAVARLRQLGASLPDHQDPDDPHLTVLLDPTGHPFCVIAAAAVHPDYEPT